jgi:hypothetical protein
VTGAAGGGGAAAGAVVGLLQALKASAAKRRTPAAGYLVFASVMANSLALPDAATRDPRGVSGYKLHGKRHTSHPRNLREPHGLVADIHPAFGEQTLHVSKGARVCHVHPARDSRAHRRCLTLRREASFCAVSEPRRMIRKGYGLELGCRVEAQEPRVPVAGTPRTAPWTELRLSAARRPGVDGTRSCLHE